MCARSFAGVGPALVAFAGGPPQRPRAGLSHVTGPVHGWRIAYRAWNVSVVEGFAVDDNGSCAPAEFLRRYRENRPKDVLNFRDPPPSRGAEHVMCPGMKRPHHWPFGLDSLTMVA